MDDKQILDLRVQLEALITEREAMVAENRQREVSGASPAFTLEGFMELANRISAVGGG